MSLKAESPVESKGCGLEVEPAGAPLAVCPARSFHRDRALYGDSDFDRLTVACPS